MTKKVANTKETTRKPERYHHFMVDSETLGTFPNVTPVLQIALVEFDPYTYQPTGNELTVFLPLVEQIKAGAIPDKNTIEWWNQPKNAKSLAEVMSGVNAAGTMEQELLKIYHWIQKVCCPEYEKEMGKTMFWAKPAAFDYPYIDGLFAKFGVPSPFNYRNVVDMSSYILSNFINVHRTTRHHDIDFWQAQQMYWAAMNAIKDVAQENEEDAHNATNDCKFQLFWLREALLNTEKYFD